MSKKETLPNLFTFGNLACGLLSILMTFEENYKLACIFILLAGLMDRYDGRIARLLNVSSELGKELDSLADLVSFGVAPSILIFNLYKFTDNIGIFAYVLVLLFPLSGAYRLARYNTTSFDGLFVGVPITIAGMLMALYAFFTVNNPTNFVLPVILTVVFSYLMVCKLRFKKV